MKDELSAAQLRVFKFMLKNKSITTKQAIDLGETRLAGRVWEMRCKGILIGSEWLVVNNRYGERRRVKRYYLASDRYYLEGGRVKMKRGKNAKR